MKNKKILLPLILITILTAIIGVIGYRQYNSKNSEIKQENYVEYNGQNYSFNDDLTTILFFGVDKDSEYLRENEGVYVVRNQEQADFILLFVIDNNTKDVNVIKINRDSMFKTSEITYNYEFDYTQLALAHTYGAGQSDSAVNLMNAVSSIFDNVIKISDYIKVPYDIVKKTTNLVGGVTVEVLQDMTNEDPRLIKGETVTLDGDLAATYVRSRINLDDDTNKTRMKRQTQYIQEFIKKYQTLNDVSFNDASDIVSMIYTNLSISYIQDIIEQVNPDSIKFYDLEGYDSMGTEFIEFNVDKQAATDLIFNIFYTPVKN